MAEHSGYVEASLTLNIHEEGVGRLHETLELMLSLLKLRWRMKEIDVVLEHLINRSIKKKKTQRLQRKVKERGKSRTRRDISP
jgi:hypothetical protein